MIKELFEGLNERGVSPVIAIVLLLMMTVAAAGAAYFWITSMQSSVQQSAGSQIEAITKQASTRIIAQATICKPPAEDDLVGYWKFDQGEGTAAEDSAGDNDGTINGASWVKYGKKYVLKFDGDDYVDYGDILDMGTSQDFTLKGWVKTADSDSLIITKEHDWWDGNPGYNLGLSFGEASARVGNGTDHVWLRDGMINDSIWHFLAATFDRNRNLTLYVDGAKVETADISWISGSVSNNRNLKVGANDYHFAEGKIDEVQIYDKALTGEKVKSERVDVTVYNAGAEEVPEGTWVANLIKNGNTIESDTYNASSLDSEERITLNFYFSKLHPGGEYTIELEGTQTSTTVSC